ncbi:hypothetical protein [uncultured Mitsuokella sp.]|jgi:hypothetical protein|uniref:hypothetical protein n=1 Tax=uncultured Mitsuokella sp. TaxID=453120 RepID=UPI00266EEAC3|nr:hypothetical protein [uncultured Mitsuokella sp.]
MGRMIVRTGVFIAAFLAIAMLVPSGGQYGCAYAQSAASLTELSSGAGTAIVRDLERRGNYKISEADDDVVIDAEAYTEGPST